MTVEERHARIVGDEIELNLLRAGQHSHVLDDARGRLAHLVQLLAGLPSEGRRDCSAALDARTAQVFVLRFWDVLVRFFVADNFKSRSAEPL